MTHTPTAIELPNKTNLLHGLIYFHPGHTETELALVIYGAEAYPQQVNKWCRVLLDVELIERRGYGGPADPVRYCV